LCSAPPTKKSSPTWSRNELSSYKQLPVNFYQIQTKFRDEIRPRFGVMRSREFIMKDAYSFHVDQASLQETYDVMYDTYCRIFTRLGLDFRPVQADTGSIGGTGSHEFHVLASSGEDDIAFSNSSDYAANTEMAEALAPATPRGAASETMQEVSTPTQTACADVAALLGLNLTRTVKAVAVVSETQTDAKAPVVKHFTLFLLRGDHDLNEIKAGKIDGLKDFRLASESEIVEFLGCKPGFIGPVGVSNKVRVIADRTVAAMSDFVCGANKEGFHLRGVNFGRDLPEPPLVADVRNVVEGDPSPDGKARWSSNAALKWATSSSSARNTPKP
jgi:prolyl-tRNA synthetase